MNKQFGSMDEPIDEEELLTLSLEELEEFLVKRYAALEKIFYTMRSYAQGAMLTEEQKLIVVGSENHFKQKGEELKAAVDAFIYHAIFAE